HERDCRPAVRDAGVRRAQGSSVTPLGGLWSARTRHSPTNTAAPPSNHTTDIGLGKIIALEEEWVAGRAGKRVSENVAEIKAGDVTSLAEPSVSPSRLRHMLRVDWDHHDLGFVD